MAARSQPTSTPCGLAPPSAVGSEEDEATLGLAVFAGLVSHFDPMARTVPRWLRSTKGGGPLRPGVSKGVLPHQ
jgi:hypothetical protein